MTTDSTGTGDRLQGLHDALVKHTAELTTSEGWTTYLNFASKFHAYSANNLMLILIQRPDATQVASYRKWQELGRQVRKGEHSIGIFAPMTRTRTDEATGDRKTWVSGFKVVSVFDVSQTDGDPLPEDPARPVLLEGDAPQGLLDSLTAIVTGHGYSLRFGPTERGENGYTRPSDKVVQVTEGLSPAQTVKTLAHEIAHMLLHVDEDVLNAEALAHRGVAEVEAESTAHLVMAEHGVATDAYTLPYVAGWSDGKPEVVAKTADRVVKTARTILATTVATDDVATAA